MRRNWPWLVVAALAALGAGVGAGVAGLGPKTYTATAQLIVSPLPVSDTTFTGIDALRDTGGRRTAVQSAAALVRSAQVADAVRSQLGGTRSRESLLRAVSAHEVGRSDVVEVSAHASSPTAAAQIANAFAISLVSQRTGSFQSQLATAIQRDTQAGLRQRVAVLKTYVGQADPTVKVASQAEAPSSGRGQDVARAASIGALAGLGTGLLAAVLLVVLFSWRARRFLEGPEYDRIVFERLAERHEALLALLEKTERRVAAREAALDARESEIVAPPAEPVPDPEIARRESELEARIASVTQREAELMRRSAALAARERELAAEPPPPAPVPVPVAAPPPPPAPAPARPAAGGSWNLNALEKLVEARGPAFPDRLDEWQSTLYFLRDYADYDGTVPASFDWLIEETFSPLF